MVTEPASGVAKPRIMRSVVVFPAPFGPRKPVTRPGVTAKLKSSTAVTWPNRFVTPVTATTPSSGSNCGLMTPFSGTGVAGWAAVQPRAIKGLVDTGSTTGCWPVMGMTWNGRTLTRADLVPKHRTGTLTAVVRASSSTW